MRADRFASVAVGVAGLTLAARVVGFGRWLVFSKTVGDTCLGDAYNTANNLPNVLFEIVAGGVLAGVVVPVVARHLGAGRQEQAGRTTSALLSWTLLVLTPVGVLAILGARIYAGTFTQADCAGGVQTAAALLVVFAPQIWFYGLAVISSGVLQAHHRFWAAAAAPLASSLVVIATYLVYGTLADSAAAGAGSDLTRLSTGSIEVLGWGTTLGVAVLALTTVVPLARLGLRLRPTLRFAVGDPRVIGRLAGASLAGLIVQQLSVLVTMLAAQHSNLEGAWTRAVWANAVYLLPFAVLVSPLQQMIFPRLSAAAAHGGPTAVAGVLRQIGPALSMLAALGACLLIGCAVPVARLLVVGPGSGRTVALAWPIAGFAPALIGFSLMGLATRTLFAQQQARRAGITSVSAWTAVIAGALVVRFAVPAAGAVTGISLAVSFGMLLGSVVGWTLARSSLSLAGAKPVSLGLARPLRVALPVAALVGAGGWWATRGLAEAGIVGAVLGSLAAAFGCTLVFAVVLWLVDRRSVQAVFVLRGLRSAAGAPGSTASSVPVELEEPPDRFPGGPS